jgi:hypothetical protein
MSHRSGCAVIAHSVWHLNAVSAHERKQKGATGHRPHRAPTTSSGGRVRLPLHNKVSGTKRSSLSHNHRQTHEQTHAHIQLHTHTRTHVIALHDYLWRGWNERFRDTTSGTISWFDSSVLTSPIQARHTAPEQASPMGRTCLGFAETQQVGEEHAPLMGGKGPWKRPHGRGTGPGRGLGVGSGCPWTPTDLRSSGPGQICRESCLIMMGAW